MTKITGFRVIDWRYPTSLHSDGSDAVHKDPDYSCVYVILSTDSDLEGYGLTFSLGRGNEVVAKMCESFEPLVLGLDLEKDILPDLMAFSRTLTQVYAHGYAQVCTCLTTYLCAGRPAPMARPGEGRAGHGVRRGA